ncbi:hypothetical protein DL764_005642 [Monosporascus ibericus]|uniref:Uncharacterized protein n=1 Tax=Monosporascus ibericus TaxID=155417 RepID=A0A4Q4T8M2_9PEZI|nr:hypothetical protein DL764_005642 [Monosporascus ibericus]
MGRLSILRKAFNKLDGSYFGKEPIDLSDDVYYALVEADQSIANYGVNMVASNLLNRLTTLFKICTLNEDVYRQEIEDLASLMLESRRSYAPKSQKSVATILTNAVDSLINIADKVDSRGPQQQVVSLRGNAAPRSTAWPPPHVSKMDVVLMAVKGVRGKIFGVSNANQGQGVALPNRLDEPLAIRAYLSQLYLWRLRPDASLAPYLAPPADAARVAQETDAPIPTAWLRSCPRTGMALVLSKAKENEKKKGKGKGRLACQAMLFRPGPPRYADAAEPTPERRARQDAWLSALFGAVGTHFDIREGYVGGTTLHRYENIQPASDSVELACQFLRELVEDPEKGVPEG